jgi:hypothetical protein
MTLFSSPSYTTMPRVRGSPFRNGHCASLEALSALASAILSDPPYPFTHFESNKNLTSPSPFSENPPFFHEGRRGKPRSLVKILEGHLPSALVMKKPPSFAVSTLVSSSEGALPQRGTLYIPPCCVEPKDTSMRRAAERCAGRKAGVDTMRVETTFLWMSDSLN